MVLCDDQWTIQWTMHIGANQDFHEHIKFDSHLVRARVHRWNRFASKNRTSWSSTMEEVWPPVPGMDHRHTYRGSSSFLSLALPLPLRFGMPLSRTLPSTLRNKSVYSRKAALLFLYLQPTIHGCLTHVLSLISLQSDVFSLPLFLVKVMTELCMVGNGARWPITHVGTGSLRTSVGSLSLQNVLVIPEIRLGLISLSQLTGLR